MKKVFSVLISLILILSCFVSAFAVRTYELDERTGDIVNNTTGETNSTMNISANCYYDKNEKEYVYLMGTADSSTLRCSVFNGMVVTQPVSIKLGTSVKIEIYRNGILYEPEDLSNINETGSYVVMKPNMGETILSFRIVSQTTCALDMYKVPDIFFIASATRDGVIVPVSGNDIDLTVDGKYEISYTAKKSNLTYNLDIVVDHQAPELEIIGVDEDGIARGPVSFGEMEIRSSIQVLRDGTDVTSQIRKEYKDPGKYVVKYADEAGNVSIYYFTIEIFFNLSAWMFVVIAIGIVALVVGYMIYSRKHTRVR